MDKGNAGMFRNIIRLNLITGAVLVVALSSAPARAADASGDARLGAVLGRLEERLGAFERRLAVKGDAGAERAALSPLRAELEAADRQALGDFERIGQALEQAKLPAAILERHRAAVKVYQAEMARLRGELDAIDREAKGAGGLARVRQAKTHLAALDRKTRRPVFDARKAPMRVLKASKANAPRLKPEDFRTAGLPESTSPERAAATAPAPSALPGSGDPAYLAATPEVVLSNAIQAKAVELGKQPVKIFNWVYNNVEWIPSWGALQSSEVTLGSRRGNAFDNASLLIALLRASNIPARYVHGTVELDAAAFRDLAGAFSSAGAAIDFASAAGLPAAAVVSGGKITKVRFEHVWVEAAVDFFPSRGAINRTPDQWVSLDPSLKPARTLAAPDYLAITGVQPGAAIGAFAASGTSDPQAGWVQGLSGDVLLQGLTPSADGANQSAATLRTFLGQYSDAQSASLGQTAGGSKTLPTSEPVLPLGLSAKLLTAGVRYAQVPASLQGSVSFAFRPDWASEPDAAITLPLARANGQKMTLSFTFATMADADAYAAFLPSGPYTSLSQLPASIPAYLVRVVPQLRLGAQVIATGSAMRLGEALGLVHQVSIPGVTGSVTKESRVIAGSHLAVAVVAGSVSTDAFEALRQRFEASDQLLATGSVDDIVSAAPNLLAERASDAYHAALLEYFGRRMTVIDLMAKGANLGSALVVAGVATFGYRPVPHYFYGTPRSIELGALGMDASELLYSAQSSSGDPALSRALMHQIGMLGSSLEGDIPAYLWTRPGQAPPPSASATNNLLAALDAGQRIYHVTASNAGAVSQLLLPAEVKDDITAAVAQGMEVIVHQSPIQIAGRGSAVSTVGYVILDPSTGAGQYLLDNGTNGGLVKTADEMLADCAYVNRPGIVNNDVDWARHQITRKCAEVAKEMKEEAAETAAGLMQEKIEAVKNFHEVYAKVPMVIADCMVAGAPLIVGEMLVLIRTGAAMLAIQAADLRSLVIAKQLKKLSEKLKDFMETIHDACLGEYSAAPPQGASPPR